MNNGSGFDPRLDLHGCGGARRAGTTKLFVNLENENALNVQINMKCAWERLLGDQHFRRIFPRVYGELLVVLLVKIF